MIVAIIEQENLRGRRMMRSTRRTYAPVGPFRSLISKFPAAIWDTFVPTPTAFFPMMLPRVGIKIKAIKKDEDRVNIRVSGKNPINSPGIPGQNNRGRNAASVVAVDAAMGHAMRWAACR